MCKEGLANKGKHHLLILHKQAHDKRSIAELMHAYIIRTRVDQLYLMWVCFWEKYNNSWNMPTPIFEEQLKLIAKGVCSGDYGTLKMYTIAILEAMSTSS